MECEFRGVQRRTEVAPRVRAITSDVEHVRSCSLSRPTAVQQGSVYPSRPGSPSETAGESWPRNGNEMRTPCYRGYTVCRRCVQRVAVTAGVRVNGNDPSRCLQSVQSHSLWEKNKNYELADAICPRNGDSIHHTTSFIYLEARLQTARSYEPRMIAVSVQVG